MDFLKDLFGTSTQSKELKPSSIDRYMWSRGISASYGAGRSTWLGLLIGGSIQAVFGCGILIAYLFFKNVPLSVSIMLNISAAIMIGMSFGIRSRAKAGLQSEVRISSNARKLISRILSHIGWTDPNKYNQGHSNQWWTNLVGIKTAANVLQPASTDLLERATFQVNRIEGLSKLGREQSGRVKQLIPSVKAASEEAIISVLNQVALLEESPETQKAITGQVEIHIEKLTELANRLESLVSQPDTLADRLSQSSVLDNVLDQIRLEEQAHIELNSTDSTTEPR